MPHEPLSVLVSRPELEMYQAKLHWVRCQMDHVRGASQARAVTGGPGHARDSNVDAQVGAVLYDSAHQEPDLQEEPLRSAKTGTTRLWATSQARSRPCPRARAKTVSRRRASGKGQTKGDQKGSGAQTDHKMGPPGGGGEHFFDGLCNHCGAYRHRKIRCRKLDHDLQGKRDTSGGKGGSSGKGLNSCDAGGDDMHISGCGAAHHYSECERL